MVTVNDLKDKIKEEDYQQAFIDDVIVWGKELISISDQLDINIILNTYNINKTTISNQLIKILI